MIEKTFNLGYNRSYLLFSLDVKYIKEKYLREGERNEV